MKRFMMGMAGVAFLVATPVSATNYIKVTSSGVAREGFDLTGMFGTPETSLNGERYDLEILFKQSLGYVETSGGTVTISGGSGSYYQQPPIMSGKLTIKGVTYTVGGNWLGYSQESGSYGELFMQDQEVHYPAVDGINTYNFYIVLQLFNRSDLSGFNFGNCSPAAMIGDPGDCNILFEFERSKQVAEAITYPYLGTYNLDFIEYAASYLSPDFVRAEAVPEPSTWALLILGFGATGATLRRRRNVVS